jgi:hypothetical protein
MENYSTSFGIGIMIIYLLLALLMIVSYWKIFTKANQPGWAILVPIYNIIVLLNIVKKPWWWFFLLAIPIVNIVIGIIITYRLALSFGKSGGFAIGLILLPFIFLPILAFDNSTYTPLQD